MTQHLNADNGGAGKIPTWIVGQLLMTSLVPVWAIGLRALWRSHGPVRRGLTWAYALLFLFFALTTGGKIYYLAGAYVPLLAAGVVALDPWLAGRVHRLRSLLSSVALTTLVALPLVLPVSDIEWTYRVNQVPAESVGWPRTRLDRPQGVGGDVVL
jgi:O-antigen ligase